jgi:hypothetical protein
MAGITPSQFRLGPDTLADIDALAASNGGQRTTAIKEAVAQFRALVESAGRTNADELTHKDWIRLGHLNDPDPMGGLIEGDESLTLHGRDWSQWLAAELVGMWEGRDTTLPLHDAESKECRALARRIAKMGRLRGYALMSALRYFWRAPEAGIEACAAPEVWLTPTARK